MPQKGSIRRDEIIRLGSPKWRRMKVDLRRVEIWDAEKKRMLVLLTNHLEFGATTISDISKNFAPGSGSLWYKLGVAHSLLPYRKGLHETEITDWGSTLLKEDYA